MLKLAAGSATQSVLPFTGLNYPAGVAVDAAGNLYVADSDNNRVVKLAAGSSTQTVLPFTGLNYPERCGGGCRRRPLRHRPCQQSGAETGGGLGHPDACCRSPASTTPSVWRWMPPATSTSPTLVTIGW